MTAEQIYKAYVGGLDIPTLARATGYGYAAIDHIIKNVKEDHENAVRVNKMTSVFHGYDSSNWSDNLVQAVKTGMSTVKAAAESSDTPVVNQNSLQAFREGAVSALAASQNTVLTSAGAAAAAAAAGGLDRSNITYDDLITALFQLGLIKSITWLPQESAYRDRGEYLDAVYDAAKKPLEVLLPLVQSNKIDAAEAAAALKSSEAERVYSINKAWTDQYGTGALQSIAKFKNSLPLGTKYEVNIYGTKIARAVEKQEKSELASQKGYTRFASQLLSESQNALSDAMQRKTRAIGEAALQNVSVEKLNQLFDLTGATSALGAAAAYRPALTDNEEENAQTLQSAAVIDEATGADSIGSGASSDTTPEDIAENTDTVIDEEDKPVLVSKQRGLSVGVKVGIAAASFGLLYLLFLRGK